jgi:protein CpxP
MRGNIKLAAITLAAIVAMACWATAQTYGTQSQQEQQGSAQQPMAGQEQMHAGGAQNRLNWLSQQLNLTDEQKTKLQPILQNAGQQMKSVRENTSLTQDQKRSQMMQIHQSTDSQIESVLTPDQQQKFAQIKQQQKERHQGMGMGKSEENESK